MGRSYCFIVFHAVIMSSIPSVRVSCHLKEFHCVDCASAISSKNTRSTEEDFSDANVKLFACCCVEQLRMRFH